MKAQPFDFRINITSATKAYQLAKRTLAMGDLTADVMACLFILSSLTNYAHLRTTVNHSISQSTKEKPYTPTDIIRLLENEQRLLNADKSTSSPATALLAKTKSNVPSCSNCKRPGHSADYCISPGGGMAGKTIEESKRARKEAMSKTSGKNPSPSSSGNKGKIPHT